MNRFVYNGKEYSRNARNLVSADAFFETSLTAEELANDTLTVTVQDFSLETRLLAADSKLVAAGGKLLIANGDRFGLNSYKYGDTVEFYSDNTLVTRQYIDTVKRIAINQWRFNCFSGVGLLESSNHYGGMYNGETVAEVVRDIIGGVFSYTIDSTFGAYEVYGWLPIATRRDNLQALLFAMGGRVAKTSGGAAYIEPISVKTPYTITDANIYDTGTVEDMPPASLVSVTEYSYLNIANDETTTLFEGESAAGEIITPKGASVIGNLITFSNPIHNLSITGASILESGVNYAVISSGVDVTLTGKKYSVTTRIITRTKKTNSSNSEVKADSCGLVNVLNSESVADRLMAYYGASKEVDIEAVGATRKTGDAVELNDAYGDDVAGYIQSVDLSLSSNTVKGRLKIIDGYTPVESGNYYTNRVVLTSNQTWTVPSSAHNRMRIILIGGGQAGYKGENGETGETPEYMSNYNGAPGEGGAGGARGTGGRIYVLTINVTSRQSFNVVIGQGGNNGNGETGGNTTFGNYTSASGEVRSNGYLDSISGEVYATPGVAGTAGGKGTVSDEYLNPIYSYVDYNGQRWSSGDNGERMFLGDSSSTNYVAAGGGTGGGAAVGSNGNAGADAYSSGNNLYGGTGGNGANGAAGANATTYGSGGNGGHGGGGGGGGGGTGSSASHSYSVSVGVGGAGGTGGNGGNGANGCVIIYY